MASSPLTLKLPVWETELARDPDKHFILQGLRNGFTITQGVPDCVSPVHCANYRSATCLDNKKYVETQIFKELSVGRYFVTSTKPTIVSAIGAIPKPGKLNSFRIIHDASRPMSRSLNSYACPDSFSFTSVDEATKFIKPGSFMCKIDISEAYRHVALHPSQYHLTGLQWHFAGNDHPTWRGGLELLFLMPLSTVH